VGTLSYGDLLKLLDAAGSFKEYHLLQRAARDYFESAVYRARNNDKEQKILWEAAYPRAYKEYVTREASFHGIDANLVYAIMREESNFRPKIVSPASAIGLMQIISPTGRWIARNNNINDFKDADLYEPKTNIKFGAWYLKKLLNDFNGKKVYAIASYNAGEIAVSRWRDNGYSNILEEFVEEIPYTETREYVRRVLTSLWIYEALYGK
jgi:soluble lytic murein transglycosylase